MKETKRNEDDKETPRETKARPIKRSASSDGEQSPPCSNTATHVWDNCTTIRATRGDEIMDLEIEKSPEIGPETRKRKLTDQSNPGPEKKSKRGKYHSSTSLRSKYRDEISARFEVQEQGMERSRAFLVLCASADNNKPASSTVGCQTVKTPLVPVSPVVSFFEPVPEGPARLENSFFGAGALLEDGTLRPPPTIFSPGSCSSKEDPPKTEEKTEVKEWMRKKNEPAPQTKKDVAKDEDQKKKNTNTDRYLNMF